MLPPGAGSPPLVENARARLKKARLRPDATEPQVTRLDLYRRPAHRETSRLLHGLRFLEVPFARHDRGPDFVRGRHTELMQEQWTYRWTPDTEAGLVEASLLGGTVEEAVDRIRSLADEPAWSEASEEARATVRERFSSATTRETFQRLVLGTAPA